MQRGESVSSNGLWNRTETRTRVEDGRSARDVPQALAFICSPDFLGRRTLWDSQQYIVLRKQWTIGHDVQMFDRDWRSVGDAVERVLRRWPGSKADVLLPKRPLRDVFRAGQVNRNRLKGRGPSDVESSPHATHEPMSARLVHSFAGHSAFSTQAHSIFDYYVETCASHSRPQGRWSVVC